MASAREVNSWYERKTDALVQKYGPGPRVHYHTGLWPLSSAPATTVESVRRQIVDSQEALLWRAARAWSADRFLRGEVVDIGCGLGGGSLFWAGMHGAQVTAVSPVATHLALVEAFAKAAGVSARVRTELADAHEIEGQGRFDAAVSIDASNYFDRRRFFLRMKGLLRRHGRVFIADTFLEDRTLEAPFNDYWLSRVGTLCEYVVAAEESGFTLVGCEDVGREAAGFWALSGAFSDLKLAAAQTRADEEQWRRSVAWQGRVRDAYERGGLTTLLLAFGRVGSDS